MPPVSVSLTNELRDKLNEYCKETSTSRSDAVSNLLRAFLDGEASPQVITTDDRSAEIEALKNQLEEKTKAIDALKAAQKKERERTKKKAAATTKAAATKAAAAAEAVATVTTPKEAAIATEVIADPLASLAMTNSSAMANMLRERGRLCEVLATQKRVIALLKDKLDRADAELQELKISSEKANTGNFQKEVDEFESEHSRTITWYPTAGVRMDIKLADGAAGIPTNHTFGILRCCLDVLEIEHRRQDGSGNIAAAIETVRQELTDAARDPRHQIPEARYNNILDEVAKYV